MKKAYPSRRAFFTFYSEIILEKLDFLRSAPTHAYFFTIGVGIFSKKGL
jgi:hypothetical protein